MLAALAYSEGDDVSAQLLSGVTAVDPTPLERVGAGDPAAVQACVQAYGSLVWALTRRGLASQADAEDAVQEIFVDLWRSAARFDPAKGSDKGFVAMVARRRLIDRRRRAGRRPDLHALSDGFDAASDAHERIEPRVEAVGVLEALNAIRDDHRRLIELSLLEGLSHSEIAEVTGMPLGTVKSGIRRGLKAARDLLVAKGWPEPRRSPQ
jgi:RNA polymerase sigma-70 factor (ECF subfamily)